ncbi:MAG: membrane protein insertase YidC [Gammaproteobacteria bacterium]|nr:membrane protein insertase YidC [Gammaproteobacteria bacterium]MCW8909368.1 membrane protein insertase YidC [Gammaproteobacteria bacterium]MCW9003689.1 membrane protein insertase YidC [Gammaproteobacteria bacterium]
MENQRTLLYLSLFFILFLIWQAWQKDYGPQPIATAPVSQDGSVNDQPESVSVNDIPESVKPVEYKSEPNIPVVTGSRSIHVITDVFDLQIDTRGGDIRTLNLRKYAKSSEHKDEPFELLTEKESKFHVAQSGLLSSNSVAPNHHTVYNVAHSEYRLAEGQDELKVDLFWQQNGVRVIKTYTFHRDDYVIDVEHKVQTSSSPWNGSQYRQLVRAEADKESESSFIYTYTGGVIFNDEIKYDKVDFSDMADSDLKVDQKGGWFAMIQHYFLAAWVPDQDESNFVYSKHPKANRYILGARSPAINVEANSQAVFHSRLVVGPKLQDRLETIAPGLELTVDYGVLTIIAKPLFWLLKIYHGWFNNWGWAIIFLTLTIKIVFFKLSETSYRSMAKMRKVAPRLQTLKERYGDDRQRMSQAMMKMYKEEKINPLGGCFPILVQIPVFIALYWVLLETVEMRHAPFALWITNLSEKDPYFILPLIMGATMFIQQKLNPAPIDPIQQKVFQFMPVMFTIFFLFFPSGLVLYWVVNNTLSITQQWVITRRIEKG